MVRNTKSNFGDTIAIRRHRAVGVEAIGSEARNRRGRTGLPIGIFVNLQICGATYVLLRAQGV